jgi:hypothetical protein
VVKRAALEVGWAWAGILAVLLTPEVPARRRERRPDGMALKS